MFRRRFIKQITSCTAGDFLFVFGLGRDGNMYIWNSIQEKWLPHVNVMPEQATPPVEEPSNE